MTRFKKPYLGIIGVSALLLLVLYESLKQVKMSRGVSGIGSLIIFIAVILVAAIAAAVFITTGGSLQQKALITSNEAREGVSSGVDVVAVRGTDAGPLGTPHLINRLYMMARLSAGSNAVNLNTTVITLDTHFSSQTYTYGGVVSDSAYATGTSDFVINYMKEGAYHEDGYINMGDMIKVKINVDGNMTENTKGRITIIPRVGNMNQIEFVTPETMAEPVVVLWPTG